MNKVDGSFDESLHMLIHRIMYVEKHYLRFLDSELMNEVEEDPPVISISLFLINISFFDSDK